MSEDITSNEVVITPFKRRYAVDIIEGDFPWTRDLLVPTLEHRILHAFGFIPREKNLIAYHLKEKLAVGFLKLVNHTDFLYSIRHVFTNPNYRKRGIATGLLNRAFKIAKEKGGKKVFLDVVPNDPAKKLYKKLGFKSIVDTSIITAAGFPRLHFENKHRLFQLDLHLKDSKNTLYKICMKSMGVNWIDFFKITPQNILNGFAQDFQRPCLKAAFINDLADSFATVSYIPPFSKVTVEVCTGSDCCITPFLRGLFRILHQKGIVYAKMTLFNIKNPELNNENFSSLKEFDFANQLKVMGRLLNVSNNF